MKDIYFYFIEKGSFVEMKSFGILLRSIKKKTKAELYDKITWYF